MAQGSNARVHVDRIPYPVPQALNVFKDVQRLILVGARAPVAFFGYPNQPSILTPEGCAISTLATLEEDLIDALERLADAVGANVKDAPVQQPFSPAMPSGALDPDKIAALLGTMIPERAIVVD